MISVVYSDNAMPKCLEASAMSLDEADDRARELEVEMCVRNLKTKEFDSLESSMNFFAYKGRLFSESLKE